MSSFNETIPTSSLQAGTGVVGTTATQLIGVTNKKAAKGIYIKHIGSNSDALFVGLEGVSTTQGYELDDGEEIFLQIEDPSLIYVVGSDGSVAYSWISY
jgi:hypothetical protein